MGRPTFTQNRSASFAYVTGAYVAIIAAAWWAFGATPWGPIGAMAAGLFFSTLICFVASRLVDNGSVYDAYWSIMPPIAALYMISLSTSDPWNGRQLAVMAVILFWAVRLTANWARSFPGLEHEDFRYKDLYNQVPLPRWAVQLLLIQLCPTLQIFLGCLPLYPALVLDDHAFGALDALALGVGIGATLIEWIADEQMRRFVRTRREGEHMEAGLWRLSRHPNYFGEMLFWISLWLFGVASAPSLWWTALGPLAMLLMFVFASIPMMDRRSTARRPGYAAYARRTSSLVPWPPRKT